MKNKKEIKEIKEMKQMQQMPSPPPAVSRRDLKRAFVLQELLFRKPLALRREK